MTNKDMTKAAQQQPASASIVRIESQVASKLPKPVENLAESASNVCLITSGNKTITRLNNCAETVVLDHHQASESKSQSNVASACAKMDKECEGRVNAFDHVTFWVGNAKQSACFYMTQFGFQPLAFRGLETGSRDLACHVVRLNDKIIQFVSAVEPNNKTLNDFLMSHGDAVKDVAFRVENIEELLKHSIEQGAELVSPLEVITFNPTDENNDKEGEKEGSMEKCILKRATIKTFGDVTHTFIERNYEYATAKFLPGYKKPSLEVSELLPASQPTIAS